MKKTYRCRDCGREIKPKPKLKGTDIEMMTLICKNCFEKIDKQIEGKIGILKIPGISDGSVYWLTDTKKIAGDGRIVARFNKKKANN